MNDFQSGDVVKCVDDTDTQGRLQDGRDYTVDKPMGEEHVRVLGDIAMWRNERFVLVLSARSHVDTREGWRELRQPFGDQYRDRHALLERDEFGQLIRAWVQQPVLPRTPYTVIRTHQQALTWDLILMPSGQWFGLTLDAARQGPYPPEQLVFDSYQVLAEAPVAASDEVQA